MNQIMNLVHNPAVVAAGSAVVVALIDLAYALNPNLKANGILHAIYVFVMGSSAQS